MAMTSTTGGAQPSLGKCEACEVNDAIGVCNCILSQPISIAYCRRCLDEGIEAWWIILGTADGCGGPPPEGHSWDEVFAPWAYEIIERSMRFHGKTWQDLGRELDEQSA